MSAEQTAGRTATARVSRTVVTEDDPEARVRPARSADVAVLADLLRAEAEHARAAAGHYQLRADFDWLAYARAKLAHPARAVLIVERSDARVAGFIDLRICRYQGNAQRSWWARLLGRAAKPAAMPLAAFRWGSIDGCYVMPDARRHGLGRTLVVAAMTWFAAQGIERIELSVVATSDTVGFWERCGFKTFRLSMWTRSGAQTHSPAGQAS